MAELTNGTETIPHLCSSQNAFDHYEANLILFKDLSLWRRGKWLFKGGKKTALNKILRFLFAFFSTKMLQMYDLDLCKKIYVKSTILMDVWKF